MEFTKYRFKFYLNASHAIYIDGKQGQSHPHTWEIAIDTLKLKESFVQFHDLEKQIDEFLEPFQDKYLNQIPPFTMVNPTLENCTEFFKDELSGLLSKLGWKLLIIEMSETPTRSYVIDCRYEEENENEDKITKDRIVKNILSIMRKSE